MTAKPWDAEDASADQAAHLKKQKLVHDAQWRLLGGGCSSTTSCRDWDSAAPSVSFSGHGEAADAPG